MYGIILPTCYVTNEVNQPFFNYLSGELDLVLNGENLRTAQVRPSLFFDSVGPGNYETSFPPEIQSSIDLIISTRY
jgi:hypothetical protein